jgi:hypothetical protein
VVLPRVGHLSNIEAGDRFNREVRVFLHKNPMIVMPDHAAVLHLLCIAGPYTS